MMSRNLLALIFISIAAATSFGQVLISAPTFSSNPGIYASDFNLSITHPDANVEIWYTTNGSEPKPNTAGSHLYTAPITIVNRTNEPNVFSNIWTRPQQSFGQHGLPYWAIPREPDDVAKGTAIRAAAFRGSDKSESISGSFFVFHTDSRFRRLPLISVIVDSLDFFGSARGIYVPGANYNNNDATGNYYQRGDDWERPGSFEYFDLNVKSDGPIISQTVGYRIHGAWTRRFPQKTLRVYARREYGVNALNFDHQLFPHQTTDTRFKRLLLRAGGNDYQKAFMRDATAQYMVSHVKTFDTQAFRSAVVFLNGEFWGLHHIRERLDKHYFARVYGVDSENIDLLDFNNQGNPPPNTVTIGASEGDVNAYNRMMTFVRNNNLANSAALDSMHRMMDIDSYFDHYAVHMILGNWDGIYNNHRLWRERRVYNRNAPVGRDGRFRWLVYDLDQIMFLWPDNQPHSFGTIFNEGRAGNELFVNLMKNESVRHHFINSFANMLNSAFIPGRAEEIIDSVAATIRPVMESQILRWRNPLDCWGQGCALNTAFWESEVNGLKVRYTNRLNGFRGEMRNSTSLRGPNNLELGADRTVTITSDTTNGFIKINSMIVDAKLPSASSQILWSGNNFSWSGTYFANVPITVSGIGKKDYRFDKWIVREHRDGANVQVESTDSVLTVRLSSAAPGDGPTCSQQCSIEAFFIYDPEYFVVGATDQRVSHKRPGLSIDHRVRSRSNVTFNFTLPEAGNVQLRVYNLAGKEVARVANGKFGPGSHQLNWNTGKMAPGVYIYRLKVHNRTIDGRLRM
jgi:hypothetical protein